MGTVGKRIKEVRKGIGMSQAQFAKVLKVTRGHVSKLEIGQASPSEQLLALISRVFMVEWDWLLTGEGDMAMGMQPLDAAEFNRQKALYLLLQERIHIFFLTYDWMQPWLENALKETAHLRPGLCPPGLRGLLRKIIKMPEAELFQLARARLIDWDLGGLLEEVEKE